MSNKSKHDELKQILGEDIFDVEEADRETSYLGKLEDLVVEKDPEHILKKESVTAIEKSADEADNYSDSDPGLSSGDIDADWQSEQNTGEEHSLGSTSTPDQDQVDEIAKPWGLGYEDSEELNINAKVREKRKRQENIDEEAE